MKRFFFLVPLLLTLSCAKEENQVPDSSEPIHVSTTISPSDALNNLNALLRDFNTATKAEVSVADSDILPVGCGSICLSTKSITVDIPDTLFYIVNFAAGSGFAVLAGDTRLGEKVLCITEQGAITPNDFASAFDELMTPSTKSTVDTEDDSFTDMGETFVPALMLSSMLADLKYGPIKESETKTVSDNLVTTGNALLRTKWHQDAPFNRLVPNEYPAGCVAIACAQIMLYNRRAESMMFDNTLCSWDDMATVCSCTDIANNFSSEVANGEVAHFVYHIGQRNCCNISYGSDGSGGYADGVVRTLKNCAGYPTVKKYLGFGSDHQMKAAYMIRDGKPVYLDGSDSGRGKGHAWVLDGEWGNYFHCNWGWRGLWDGYYAKHNYFPVVYREGYDSTDPGTKETNSDKDYDWNFRMVTYAFN